MTHEDRVAERNKRVLVRTSRPLLLAETGRAGRRGPTVVVRAL